MNKNGFNAFSKINVQVLRETMHSEMMNALQEFIMQKECLSNENKYVIQQ